VPKETSNQPDVPAITGENTAGGNGVVGLGRRGVVGESRDYPGVKDDAGPKQGVFGKASAQNAVGVQGESALYHGVWGVSHDVHNGGVLGSNDSQGGLGVIGIAEHGDGIGVSGHSPNIGVRGKGHQGVVGESDDYQGVYGLSHANAGVVGEAAGGGRFGVYAVTDNDADAALVAVHKNRRLAGQFFGSVHVDNDLDVEGSIHVRGSAFHVRGDVHVSGDVFLTGGDVAEQFEVRHLEADDLQPGSVVVLDDLGRITTSDQPYDCRVAGIVSGAGDRVPAIVLDRVASTNARMPVAVMGKAWCLVDATEASIRVGDMLTTSARRGYARRASDKLASIGATLGKALTPLSCGIGQVLVLVSLG
jgi:hypothetical protein